MGASKEYFMRLREEEFESLENEAQNYLMHLGMQVRQLPTKLDESDEHYQKIRKHRIETWNKEQGQDIAEVFDLLDEENMANCQLISKAPEMLKMLKLILEGKIRPREYESEYLALENLIQEATEL